MNIGDRVVVVRDYQGDRNGYGKVGLGGEIVRHSGSVGGTHSLCWDVKLDTPLPDGREFLWFSTRELQVL